MTKEDIIDKYTDQLESWKPERDIIEDAIDEYAKQQAIEFFKFCMPGPVDFEPHVSIRYDQFIEQ